MDDEIAEAPATVADVAKITAEVDSNNSEKTLLLVKACVEAGALVTVNIHHTEPDPVRERFENVSIGAPNWRQDFQVPASMPMKERNELIRSLAVGAAEAYADGLAIVTRAENEAKAAKGAK